MRKKNLIYFSTVLFCIFLFCTSCVNTKNTVYFNDIQEANISAALTSPEPVIQKSDLLSITVSSLTPQSSLIFNAPNTPVSSGSMSNPNAPQTAGYLVSQEGAIKFPMLGSIKVEGLTKKQLEDTLSRMLLEKKLLYDPIVNVRYLNYRVTVLGEVARPGIINVPDEQLTVLEAIGQAGDLTIYAKRDNVLLIRMENGTKKIARLNLNSSALLNSPYYFLKSNDVLYVEPGKAKIAAASTERQLLPTILSGLSFVAIILTRIIK